MRMHKKTRGDNSKDSINYSRSVKRRDLVGYGGVRAAIWAIYSLCGGPRLDGVLMTSGRALPRKGAKRLRSSGRIKLTVCPKVTAHVRT
jgi:hypothetical protein